MNEIVLMSDPAVAAIPVVECGERLVDGRKEDPAGAFARLRESLVERLLYAQDRLPADRRLLFVEGYRPPSLHARTSTGTPAGCGPPFLPDPRPSCTRRPAGTRVRPSTSRSPTPKGASWTWGHG